MTGDELQARKARIASVLTAIKPADEPAKKIERRGWKKGLARGEKVYKNHERCTAIKRCDGTQCKRPSVDNKRKKCRNHGGMTPLKRLKPGHIKVGSMYSKYYSQEDKKVAELAKDKAGTLDSELELARVHLARAVRLKDEQDDKILQLEEIEESDAGIKKKFKRVDYDALILKISHRIELLERSRKELMSDNQADKTLVIIGGLPDDD